MMKSYFPASPVLSNTGRSTPVSCGFVRYVAIISMGTFRAPTWKRPDTGHPENAPHDSGNPPATVGGGAPGAAPGASCGGAR